jgi:hypothetical protein
MKCEVNLEVYLMYSFTNQLLVIHRAEICSANKKNKMCLSNDIFLYPMVLKLFIIHQNPIYFCTDSSSTIISYKQ